MNNPKITSPAYPLRMRRLLPLAVLAAIVIAGCGSSSSSNPSGSAAGTARQTELSYFPAGTPFVISLVTDPKSNQIQSLEQLLGHFPIVSFGEQALLTKVQQLGVNYDTEIKPLLGDPVSVGFGSSSTGVNPNDVLIVWMVPSAGKLQTLLKKIPGIKQSGSAAGATFYTTGGTATVGVKGSTLVLATTQQNVQAAFQRQSSGGGFSASEYNELTSGLPADPLISAFGDLRGVLSNGSAAAARAIPWVAAVKGYGVAINTTASNLTVNFRVDTTGRSLTSSQLPLASGTSAPSFAGSGAVTAALSNPGQAITFILQAIRLTDPSQLSALPAAGVAAISSLESQLSGNAIVSSDLHTTMFRAALADPSKALSQLQSLIKTGGSGPAPTSVGGGFYKDGKITFGIVDGQLLIGNAPASQLQSFATAPTSGSGAQGSAAFKVSLTTILAAALQGSSLSSVVGTITNQLGDINGSVQATTSALTGQATIAVH